jgi:hypothetical protein
VARSAQQVGERVWCTVCLRQQYANAVLPQSHAQCCSQLDSKLALGHHIDRPTGQIGEHPGRGGAYRCQRHARVQFCRIADSFGTDSRGHDQPVVIGEAAERRIQCRSPIVRVDRLDKRNMYDVSAALSKQPTELARTITSDQNTSTSQRPQSVSV